LIRDALIEGRNSEKGFEKDGYAVKWTFVNDLELIFVVGAVSFTIRGEAL
jgi:signal recognition particle receptor subunit alpha